MDFELYLWPAVPAITIMLIVYIIGLFGNTMVVLVTFRNKSLSSTCNYLIAFESIASTVHVSAHWYLGYLIYSGTNAVPLQRCTYVMTVPIVGLCVGNVFVLMIALDRLAMVIAPIQYHRINKTAYLILSNFLGFVFAAYTLISSYLNAAKLKDVKVICLIVEAMHGTPYTIYSATSMSINIATFACYAIMFVVLKLKDRKIDNMFKPLMVMISIIFFSWVLTSTCLTLTSLTNNAVLIFYTPMYVGITVNVSCACNFYVLYCMSGEYRQQFNCLLGKLCGRQPKSARVSGVSCSTGRHKVPSK